MKLRRTYLIKKHSDSNKKLSETDIRKCLIFDWQLFLYA